MQLEPLHQIPGHFRTNKIMKWILERLIKKKRPLGIFGKGYGIVLFIHEKFPVSQILQVSKCVFLPSKLFILSCYTEEPTCSCWLL